MVVQLVELSPTQRRLMEVKISRFTLNIHFEIIEYIKSLNLTYTFITNKNKKVAFWRIPNIPHVATSHDPRRNCRLRVSDRSRGSIQWVIVVIGWWQFNHFEDLFEQYPVSLFSKNSLLGWSNNQVEKLMKTLTSQTWVWMGCLKKRRGCMFLI